MFKSIKVVKPKYDLYASSSSEYCETKSETLSRGLDDISIAILLGNV